MQPSQQFAALVTAFSALRRAPPAVLVLAALGSANETRLHAGGQHGFLDKLSGGFFKDADQHPVRVTFAHNPKLADVFSAFNRPAPATHTSPVLSAR